MKIGVDLGGSKISAVLLKNGVVVKKHRIPTSSGTRKDLLGQITKLALDFKDNETKSMGIGIPGFCSSSNRIVYIPHLTQLLGVNLQRELQRRTGLSVTVENDANCFALAEQRMGVAKNKKHVVGIVIGTGVGCGLILNGEIYRGAGGGAGELGHVRRFHSGKMIDFEDIISGPALLKLYNNHSTRTIFSLTEMDKKSWAYHKVKDTLVMHAGLMVANIINTLNPECVVLGGGVSNLDLNDEIEQNAKLHSLPELYKYCKICKNSLGDDAGVIGAAMLS